MLFWILDLSIPSTQQFNLSTIVPQYSFLPTPSAPSAVQLPVPLLGEPDSTAASSRCTVTCQILSLSTRRPPSDPPDLDISLAASLATAGRRKNGRQLRACDVPEPRLTARLLVVMLSCVAGSALP